MPEYSISQVRKFEECPLQYKFIYLDRLGRREEGIEAFTGLRFHKAMQRLYQERSARLVPLEELLAWYEARWAERWHDEVVVRKDGMTADDYRKMGRRCIEDYYRHYEPFDEGRVLGLERWIRFPLDDEGRYVFKGVIDRLMLAPDGAFEVHDYKTGSKLPEQEELDADRQLAVYEIGVRKLWPEAETAEVRLIWHEVNFDVEMRSSRTEEERETLTRELEALIDRIEAEREFEPRENQFCGWCAYQDLCPAKKGPKREGEAGEEREEEKAGEALEEAAMKGAEKGVVEGTAEGAAGKMEEIERAVGPAEKDRKEWLEAEKTGKLARGASDGPCRKGATVFQGGGTHHGRGGREGGGPDRAGSVEMDDTGLTNERVAALLRFIPVLEGAKGREMKWTGSERRPDGVYTMPYPIYPDELMEFIREAGRSWWMACSFMAGGRMAEMLKSGTPPADLEEIKTALVTIVRAERFCDGAWADIFEHGWAIPVLYKLREIWGK